MSFPTIDDIKKVIPVPELAKLAGIPRRTLYTWLSEGDVPGDGASREWRIKAVNSALATARKAKKRARAA